MNAQEFGMCEMCGQLLPLERTYFYYDIHCQCCGCKEDGRNMHFELIKHCADCVPDIPKKIHPVLKSAIDNKNYTLEIENMRPYKITGQYCIK